MALGEFLPDNPPEPIGGVAEPIEKSDIGKIGEVAEVRPVGGFSKGKPANAVRHAEAQQVGSAFDLAFASEGFVVPRTLVQILWQERENKGPIFGEEGERVHTSFLPHKETKFNLPLKLAHMPPSPPLPCALASKEGEGDSRQGGAICVAITRSVEISFPASIKCL